MSSATEEFPRQNARILVVEDDREMCRFLEELLTEEGYHVKTVNDGPAALEEYRLAAFDLVITDLLMPRMKGTELVRQLKALDPGALVLLVTAFGSIESAIEAMQAGAFHYVTKPFRSSEILIHVQRALAQHLLQKELDRLRVAVHGRYQFKNFVGRSEKMQRIFEMIARVSDLSANVLIMGESGSGKEMVAHALHSNGSRSTGPFVAVNCAAIPETLLESELFGYVRGAFTDAKKDRQGLFQEANGGVLFLDEIGEIPLNLQAKLLRVIEDKEVRPLGANKGTAVDVRLISASNRDLEQMVQAGGFRQDLYYRLNVIRIELPALRERAEDIPQLVEFFIRKFNDQGNRKVKGVSEEALAALVNYRWPGNVRELEHIIERAALLGRAPEIGLEDLPPQFLSRNHDPAGLHDARAKHYTLRDLERDYITKVLEATNGRKTEAAKILGVDRTTLYRKLEEYKIKN